MLPTFFWIYLFVVWGPTAVCVNQIGIIGVKVTNYFPFNVVNVETKVSSQYRSGSRSLTMSEVGQNTFLASTHNSYGNNDNIITYHLLQ